MTLDLATWLPEFPVREQCLYLNHAAVAPLPRRVAAAMHAQTADQESGGSRGWQHWQQSLLAVRTLAADLVASAPGDISIVPNASAGLSMVAQGIRWRKGDAVLLGEEEFAGNVAPWLALADRGVHVVRFPSPSGRVNLDSVAALLQPPVRLLSLSWVSFHAGWIAPVSELARLAKERGILVVLDAVQGLGVLPDSMASLGVDAMVAGGHTWLLGPEGAGLLVTREEFRETLAPVMAGWANTLRDQGSLFLDQLRPLDDGRRFEPGGLPTILLAGLAAALELLLEAGVPAIHERVTNHTRTLTSILLQRGWEVLSPGSGHPIAGIVAARHPFLPAEEVVRRLHHRRIEVAAKQGLVRFSPHFYATAGELDALRVILEKL